MSDTVLTLLFDSILALLLIATISYCSKLSRRIRMLQDSRGELAGMITQFDTATQRAMTSLGELQTVSKRITEALQLKIDKANFLADDLAFLIEKSTKLVTQMEQAKAQRAEPVKPKSVFEPRMEFESRPAPQTPKPRATILPAPAPVPQPEISAQTRATLSLEAVLQRLASGASGNTEAASAAPHATSSSGPRTSVERELLEALKAGR